MDFTRLLYDHRAYLADLRRLHGTYWKDFQLGEVEDYAAAAACVDLFARRF